MPLPSKCLKNVRMSMDFIIDGCKETTNLNVAPLDLFTCMANTKELLDCLTNNWIGPWGIADVMVCVMQEAEFLEETVS